MALTLEKHEKERRQWVADISHELRTPVAVLQGEIEALLDGIRNVTPGTIRSLHAETLRLKRLVEDLYQLSLSDLGALNYHKENLDPVEALRNSIESYRAEFDRKGIRSQRKIDNHTKAVCFADKERLRHAFCELAGKFPEIHRCPRRAGNRSKSHRRFIMIKFQDSPPGVSPEGLERLFDRFYRVEESRSRESGGAGLGLSISRKLLKLMKE